MKNHVAKTVALVLTAMAGLTAYGCAGSAKTTGNGVVAFDPTPVQSPTATLVVLGMSCPLCAHNVDKQLKDIPGVKSVNVDMGSGRVAVAFAEGARVSRKDLAEAIHKSGFTLDEVRVP